MRFVNDAADPQGGFAAQVPDQVVIVYRHAHGCPVGGREMGVLLSHGHESVRAAPVCTHPGAYFYSEIDNPLRCRQVAHWVDGAGRPTVSWCWRVRWHWGRHRTRGGYRW